MNLELRSTIPAGRDALWELLVDVPQVATCVPGVEAITSAGDNRYAGHMRIKVGPVALALEGTMTVQEQDQQQWKAIVHVEAKDRRVGGGLDATAVMSLVENAPAQGTELIVHTDARLFGKIGEFGQPLIRRKAESLMQEFARNVAARFQ
jgi:carbon monoxide dehydrogenase subunit G